MLEAGEQLSDAIRREVLEETGLEVKPLSVFEIFERIMRDNNGAAEYHYVLIDYLCKITGGEMKASDDASNVRWVKRRELAGYKLTDGTLAVIERAFDKRNNKG